ncbi:diguanylate cyclase domain-containing protein [Roseibium sp.]|uniref:sensor domain-containing diguanylate cyclase n=1 Tax=Roseibium sp. TaxID=1936156 RepID=UPI003B523799
MTEFRRRYTDKSDSASRTHISRLAFLLAALLIAVTSISLAFVGYVASLASTKQAIANEERLFRNALDERLRDIVREQSSIGISDETVTKLVRGFDPVYARQSFNMLWTNYRHNKVLLISGTKQILAESFQDYTHITKRPASETPALTPVIQRANELYAANRVRVPGGFGHRSVQGLELDQYALMGVIRLDGKPALYSVIPVMPDNYDITLPGGDPTLLMSVKYIDGFLLERLNSQLNFTELRFEPKVIPTNAGPSHLVKSAEGVNIGSFRWNSQTVVDSIWPTVIPVIAMLSVTLAALAFGIAWKIGQLTRSLQKSEEQNRYLALHDNLSGLANRLQFTRVLESSTAALPSKPFAILHCDLDKFKEVNDTFGHAAGDTVIKMMAKRLKEVVGKPGLVSRIGGDEFMIIYRAGRSRKELDTLCRALISKTLVPIPLEGGNTANIGLSIGVAIAPADGTLPEELVARSDAALYRAKDLGRGQHFYYSDLMKDSFLPEHDATTAKNYSPLRA